MADGSFEARLSAKRESKRGIFITLEVQPDDLTEALSMLRVGSDLMIGWSEVINSEVEEIEIEPRVMVEIAR